MSDSTSLKGHKQRRRLDAGVLRIIAIYKICSFFTFPNLDLKGKQKSDENGNFLRTLRVENGNIMMSFCVFFFLQASFPNKPMGQKQMMFSEVVNDSIMIIKGKNLDHTHLRPSKPTQSIITQRPLCSGFI